MCCLLCEGRSIFWWFVAVVRKCCKRTSLLYTLPRLFAVVRVGGCSKRCTGVRLFLAFSPVCLHSYQPQRAGSLLIERSCTGGVSIKRKTSNVHARFTLAEYKGRVAISEGEQEGTLWFSRKEPATWMPKKPRGCSE